MRLTAIFITAATLGCATIGVATALAGDVKQPRAVVELFTSQGCSSCPPADKILGELADRGDVVALSYHVDYWDYLGWRDTLAVPGNSERQYAYGRSFGDRSVYTPQAVINGRSHMSGARGREIDQAIDAMAGTPSGMTVDVSATYSGESIIIRLGEYSGAPKAHVVLAYLDPESTISISRGENKGRTVVYRNAVKSVQTVGMWHGRAAQLEVPVAEMEMRGAKGCAILLQTVDASGLPGAILGATLVSMAGW